MTAKEYLTERNRMCKASKNHCCECKMAYENNGMFTMCNVFQYKHPDQAIAIVKEWSKAHPIKTYKDVFLEKYPNAKLFSDFGGLRPNVCRNMLYGIEGYCDCKCVICWNEPMEQEGI